MNKRLEKEFGERIAEKRGWHWAMTSFVFEAWHEIERGSDGNFAQSQRFPLQNFEKLRICVMHDLYMFSAIML